MMLMRGRAKQNAGPRSDVGETGTMAYAGVLRTQYHQDRSAQAVAGLKSGSWVRYNSFFFYNDTKNKEECETKKQRKRSDSHQT